MIVKFTSGKDPAGLMGFVYRWLCNLWDLPVKLWACETDTVEQKVRVQPEQLGRAPSGSPSNRAWVRQSFGGPTADR